MYTTAKVSEQWRSLFPKIKVTNSGLEISARGQTAKILSETRTSQVQGITIKQYR